MQNKYNEYRAPQNVFKYCYPLDIQADDNMSHNLKTWHLHFILIYDMQMFISNKIGSFLRKKHLDISQIYMSMNEKANNAEPISMNYQVSPHNNETFVCVRVYLYNLCH